MCVVSHFSRVQLCAPPWTVACQAPLSMVFSRQEYWNGLPRPSPRDLPHPGIEPRLFCLLHWQVASLPLVPPSKLDIKYIKKGVSNKQKICFLCKTIWLSHKNVPSFSTASPNLNKFQKTKSM